MPRQKPKQTSITNTSDEDFFKAAMRDVTPLKTQKRRISPPRSTPAPTSKQNRLLFEQDQEETPQIPVFSDYEKLTPVTSDDLLIYATNGISTKVLRNLRRGQYNPDATLDLHGKTIHEAREALGYFLIACRQRKIQCVQIIHGRGTGIPKLKNRLNHWLRETPLVLAFCSVHSGALYVLLTRKTNK